MCFSCICLFVLYVLVFVIFLFLLVRGLAAVCDDGTPWTFLLTFLLKISISFPQRTLISTKGIGFVLYYTRTSEGCVWVHICLCTFTHTLEYKCVSTHM